MKKKFTKILGVGLTLALLCSLLLTAAPVSANVTEPGVTLDNYEISAANVEYTITFRINTQLDPADPDTISVMFPDDTGVTANPDVTIEAWHLDGGTTLKYGEVDTATAARVGDTREVVLDWANDPITTLGVVTVKFATTGTGITNPSDVGDYTLEVKTSEEDVWVESESYEIIAPLLAGGVYVYNAAHVQMSFETDLVVAVDSVTGADWSVEVGPGTYVLSGTLTLADEGLTLKSSAGAEDTTIDAGDTYSIPISAANVTIDGFTIENSGNPGINIVAADATVKNNIITAAPWVRGIEVSGTGATISGNELDVNSTMYLSGASDCTLSDNDFGAGINLEGTCSGNAITDNTIIGAEYEGIHFEAGGTYDDNLIEGNTISETTEGDVIGICLRGTVTNLKILNNDITDNEGDGIRILSGAWALSNVIKFNTITGNEDDGIQNDSGADVDATFNWWGTTDADDIGDMVSADVTYEPFLTDTAEAAIVDGKAAGDTSSLDAKTECGVKVSGMDDDADDENADVICALKYIANPEEAIGDAIGFYDVYVVLETAIVLSEVDATLKFYDTAITAGSTVSFWTGDFWALCSDQEARAGLVWVTVTEDTAPTIDELMGTPFVVVGGVAVELGTPEILAPVSGDDDVSLTPIFAWGAATGADGYYFEFADNANFVTPMVKLDGDLGRLVVTAYAYVGELPYSTAYYWRVKAVSGTVEAGNLAESAWSTGVFITMEEPEEELPPVVVEEAPPVIIEPIVEVITPAATEITPAWIYVIIGVGAVLVIALLVLIVRTRRVA